MACLAMASPVMAVGRCSLKAAFTPAARFKPVEIGRHYRTRLDDLPRFW